MYLDFFDEKILDSARDLKEILFMLEQNPEIQDTPDQVLSEMETTSKKTLDILKSIKAARS